MAGRIREDDIAAVRERARIDEVVGDHVALRKGGVGSLRGLCPFHDERTPSFHVRPQVGLFHCFGCGEGGDVIAFAMKIDHLSFVEAVERLAARAGVELHYADDLPGGHGRRGEAAGRRRRLAEANAAAAAFYRDQLAAPEARPARGLLAERGLDGEGTSAFGVGYAPRSGDALYAHLRGRGFTDDELVTAGLVGKSASGRTYDRFRGRLLWPIRDVTGDTLGFGARRLFDDDRIEAKYLNTPDTPLYRKAHVLYGVDLAKREISRQRQAVVVEGYTDVMACHLAGVTTAVATCGTAFGEDHARVLRRLLGDTDAGGEVVFTFDGDAAGRRAAMRAFGVDQQLISRTSVAVEPTGKDPCELRQAGGDQAVLDLVAARTPLFEFAIRSVIADHDLETEEGRMAALDAAAPIVAGIRDTGLRHRYAVNLDRWTGFLDERFVLARVARAARPAAVAEEMGRTPQRPAAVEAVDPVLVAERAALAVALQVPDLVAAELEAIGSEAFSAPAHRAIHEAVQAVGGAAGRSGVELVVAVRELVPASVLPMVTELAVTDLPVGEAELPRYARSVIARVAEAEVTRSVLDLTRRLARLDPRSDADAYRAASTALHTAHLRQRALRERAIGA
ncbi:MAG: DNA primase [Actinomycetales bacterium]